MDRLPFIAITYLFRVIEGLFMNQNETQKHKSSLYYVRTNERCLNKQQVVRSMNPEHL